MINKSKSRGCFRLKLFTSLALAGLFVGSSSSAFAGTTERTPSALEVSNQQQTRTITGTVVDSKGEPLPGASIAEVGTTMGAVTDINGKFTLNVQPNAMLSISYIGFKTKTLAATPNMRVVLEEDTEMLGEVVVVGYGSQKKVNLTGAVASVDVAKTIDSRPVADIGRALQGAVPGLVVSTSSGEIGGAPSIKIRGNVGSPNGTGTPLILVDNVEITDISLINPDDIESISVLKDAASASIYGARGAFGVLLITTKSKQQNDRLSVKYSTNFAWRTPTVKPTQLPGWQQASINLQGVQNLPTPSNYYSIVGTLGVVTEADIPKMKEYWDKYGFGDSFGPEMVEGRDFYFDSQGMHMYRTFDWYDMFIKDWMPQQSHNLSINGGNSKTSYNIGLGYLDQEGLTKVNSDQYKRYNASLSINSALNKYISINAGVMYTRADKDTPFTFASDLYDRLYYLYRWQPFYPYGTIDGKPFRGAITELEQAPMNKQERDYVRLNGGITIKPIEGLTIDLNGTYTSTETRLHKNGGPVYAYDSFNVGTSLDALKATYKDYITASYKYAREEFGRTQAFTGNMVATYSKRIGDHDFKVMAGSSLETSEYKYFWAQRMAILSQEKPELNLATGDQTVSSDHTHWAVAGFFGRINYAYKDRYLFELNGRYDGSSSFPKGSRFAFFPSGSIGWRVSEEAFMEDLKPVLSTLKLRGSYGSIGNQNVGTDRFVSTLTTSSDSWIIDGQKTQSTGRPTLVSKELRWETVTTLDFGFDARFFDDALGITFDWYNRKTSDILTQANLPSVLGASAPYENMGAIETPGIEIAVDYRHTFNNGLTIGVGASLSDYTTKVTKWTTNTSMPAYGSGGTGWYSSTYFKEGMRLGDIWGLQFDRFLTEADFNADGSLKDGLLNQKQVFPTNYRFAPGDVLYKDLNGDGSITKGTATDKPGDLSIIGNTLPRYQFGFNFDAAYKGFDFNMFLQGVAKMDMWAAGNQVLPGYTTGEPYYEGAEDYWTPENTGAYYPRPYAYNQAQTGNFQVNDRYLMNMAYLRFKTLTIGYTLPKALLSKYKIQNLRVYFTGENLFTITGLKPDIDPEIGIRMVNSSQDARNYGRSYPYQKSLSVGLQLSL
ncbi:MAG: TonB-dependent receptor [Prevotellaceae bacterium]|jgi:TonB-linked SusC/RagA family outer membrane protein|nr:TonB-dependent receptor [Prevotellaceae bacterium]